MKLKRKRYKLPTTLNTTEKDKAQKVAQQRLIKNAVRCIPSSKIPNKASSVNKNELTQTRRKAYMPERSERH